MTGTCPLCMELCNVEHNSIHSQSTSVNMREIKCGHAVHFVTNTGYNIICISQAIEKQFPTHFEVYEVPDT